METKDKDKELEMELENKLNNFLQKQECVGEECEIKDPDELVQREHKKIVTHDGRQLLSEYI